MFGAKPPAALDEALRLGVRVSVLNPAGGTHHPNLYLARGKDSATAIVGSANLTAGLLTNVEVAASFRGATRVGPIDGA